MRPTFKEESPRRGIVWEKTLRHRRTIPNARKRRGRSKLRVATLRSSIICSCRVSKKGADDQCVAKGRGLRLSLATGLRNTRALECCQYGCCAQRNQHCLGGLSTVESLFAICQRGPPHANVTLWTSCATSAARSLEGRAAEFRSLEGFGV